MAITFSQFCPRANKQYKLITPSPERSIIGTGTLSNEDIHFMSDYLYLGNVSQLPDPQYLVNSNLLLFEDKQIGTEYFQINSLNMIITKDLESYENMKKHVRDIFDMQIRINNFAYGLLNMCQRGASVKELLNTGYSVLGNPILFLDSSLCLVDHVGAESISDEPVIERTLENGYITPEYFDAVMDEIEKNTDPDFPELIIWEKEFLTHRLIAGRIVRNNHLMGYLKLFECNHPITLLDKQYLIILCQFVAMAITESTSSFTSNNSKIEDLLTSMLEMRITDKNAIDKRTKFFNIDLQDSLVTIIVDYAEKLKNPDALYLIKKRLQNHFHKNSVVIYHDNIIILLSSKNMESTLSTSNLASFEKLLEENNCTASISMVFHSMYDFWSHYQQSEACLTIRNRLSLPERILMYDDLKLKHMFLQFDKVCPLQDLIHKDVKLLLEVDRDKNTELVETLFCFVRHRQDITAASKEMHLHYNTMKYRINRILDMTDIDFNDPKYMFKIIISEKVLDILNKMDTAEIK